LQSAPGILHGFHIIRIYNGSRAVFVEQRNRCDLWTCNSVGETKLIKLLATSVVNA